MLTRWPTRVPQRAQKRSIPCVYAAPHVQHDPEETSLVTFVPQWPQNGIPASTGFAHLGHVFDGASGESRGGMRPPEPTAALGDGASAATPPAEGEGDGAGDPDEYAGTTRAADAEIGFPQSMQKRDIGSFSRPQKAQTTRGVTIGGVRPWSANIRGAKQGRQQNHRYLSLCANHYLLGMPLLRDLRACLALPLAAAIACGGSAASPAPAPVPAPGRPTVAPPLPPVPAVDGPLAVRVQYPSPNQQITSRDSNFIFGSVGSGRASLTINGYPARVYPNGAFMGWLPNPPGASPRYELVAARGADTVRSTLPIRYPSAAPERVAAPDSAARKDSLGVVQIGQASAAADTDRTIIGKPIPGGTYKWFFTPGTIVPLMERVGGSVRVRLDNELDVYLDSAEVRDMPAGTLVPRRVMSNMRVRGSSTGVDVIIPIGQRAPYFVEEGDRSITLTLYGVRGNTDIINYATADSMVRTVEWKQVGNERAIVTVNLRAAPFGYLVLWENNALVLKLRGRPAIDPNRPLAGLTIAVDPGHPPIGSTGPTGLYEANAVLPISVRLKRMLEERGARVVMTRTTDSAVALGDRPIIARKANAHAFVSIHLNAYPDGVNPFLAAGTGTYFFRTHSEPLAREVQRGMVSQMGLVDLGVNYDNLAVVRGTWYPAVLCEGAFIILPDQEAALRTPEFQERYAKGVADGVENYFRSLSTR
jgi:N-acetylmuramoyl-L-alanine amidase